MAGLKYLCLTCLCLIVYSFIPEHSEHEYAEFYAKGTILDNFSIEELLSPHPKPVMDVSIEELRIRSGRTYQ